MNIGTKIKRLRIERGYTQVELSELSNLSIRTIQRIENNEVDPTSHSLKSLGNVLNVDLVELKNNNTMKDLSKQTDLWLVLLHLSGLFMFVIPPLVIYLYFKGENELIEEHGKDVLNFQISVFLILTICGILSILILPLLIAIVIGFYTMIRIVLNTIYVAVHKPYKYPKLFVFVK